MTPDIGTIYKAVKDLIAYGLRTHLLATEDVIYATNRILDTLRLDAYADPGAGAVDRTLEDTLGALLDYACAEGIIRDTVAERDLFDTRLMGCLTPAPHEVIAEFARLRRQSPQAATDWFYMFCQDTDYIRRYRTAKDIGWPVDTEYGELEITINLAKPEKDPRDIAAAGKAGGSNGYPRCQLCLECEGYAGRLDYPARQNHRIIPISIAGAQWGFQYSPYVYYNEHCLAINSVHTPMRVDDGTFERLFDFLELFPHYFIGSNADLPIVGGSILSHDHFQGGRHEFAMAKAPIEERIAIKGHEDVEAGIVRWPLSVIRLRSGDRRKLSRLASHILRRWREYSDASVGIHSHSGATPHNTITPIARKSGGGFELDLALRNNRTTEEHPLGLFHPHAEYHHIKSENIGLIEVMGLAVLPGRLERELGDLAAAIANNRDPAVGESTAKHAAWAKAVLGKYGNPGSAELGEIIRHEVGLVFMKVLECCGVFKRDDVGREAFRRFVTSLE